MEIKRVFISLNFPKIVANFYFTMNFNGLHLRKYSDYKVHSLHRFIKYIKVIIKSCDTLILAGQVETSFRFD